MWQFDRSIGALSPLISGMLFFLNAPVVSAYEVLTHTALTDAAAERSNLDQGVLRDLGVGNLKSTVNGRSIKEWLMTGADYEDNTIPLDDSANQTWARYRNHFYNPITGEGYKFGVLKGRPSPTWGLEDEGDIPGQNNSLKDAYDRLREALTLPTKAVRDEKFAEMLQTLGHTVHLVQDAAQPQHTRNDSHALGSLYETYVLKLTKKSGENGGLQFGNYPIVTFSTAREFFHTEDPGAGNVLVGKGMAEYSNRGFVTTGTNFKGTPDNFQAHAGFPTPNEVGAVVSTKNIRDFAQFVPSYFSGDITFIETNVPDTYRPDLSAKNSYTSSYSIFNADLNAYLDAEARDNPSLRDVGPEFTFNKISANAAQQFLIPRAVSYSAGLINWFFRGKIDMVKDPANPSQYLIKNLGTEPLQGTFTLYYDDTSDVRHEVPGAVWSTASFIPGGILQVNSQFAIPNFTQPSDIDRYDKFFLVFTGETQIEGAENGQNLVLGQNVILDCSRPDFFIDEAYDRVLQEVVTESTIFWEVEQTVVARYVGGPSATYTGRHVINYGTAQTEQFYNWPDPYIYNRAASGLVEADSMLVLVNGTRTFQSGNFDDSQLFITNAPIVIDWEATCAF